ncbi:hypothetical protein, partial [Vibrio furnissii]
HQGRIAYLEHLGMLNDKAYEYNWSKKKENYESAGISEVLGNLIITEDGLNGSLDAKSIESKIHAWMNNG